MKSDRFTQIGLDRVVRLAWLERVSSLALAGNDAKTIKSILQEDLRESFRSERTDVRGSLDKTITILLKTWITPPLPLESLCAGGIELLAHLAQGDKLVIHWGMVMAVYPFWSNVALQVGRLLRLQGTAAATHVQRRIREQYGERETVSRRTRYVLRSYLDWGVLQQTATKGIYSAGTARDLEDHKVIAWLIEAALRARVNGAAPLSDLIQSPSIFPFQIRHVHAENLVASSSRLDIIRHGLDEHLVILKNQTSK